MKERLEQQRMNYEWSENHEISKLLYIIWEYKKCEWTTQLQNSGYYCKKKKWIDALLLTNDVMRYIEINLLDSSRILGPMSWHVFDITFE